MLLSGGKELHRIDLIQVNRLRENLLIEHDLVRHFPDIWLHHTQFGTWRVQERQGRLDTPALALKIEFVIVATLASRPAQGCL